MKARTILKTEHAFRRLLVTLPPKLVVDTYSRGRNYFLEKFEKEHPKEFNPPKELERTLWGITFRSPIGNAAGMFKNGESYDVVALQGAGFYLAGTTTAIPRDGNLKNRIKWPFVPYPRSHSSSNFMGLPNKGHHFAAERLANAKKINNCPIGASLAMDDSEVEEKQGLDGLVEGMKAYEKAGIDFIEINDSCSNTTHSREQEQMRIKRLRYLSEKFLDNRSLKNRQRKIPVIVKFSTDTQLNQVHGIIDMLISLGYDGVDFGNTSTDYQAIRNQIDSDEKKLFDYFIRTFGGGISGEPLKARSIALSSQAIRHLKLRKPAHEFHVIRTGGIQNAQDLIYSDRTEIPLNAWFTGYWNRFSHHGHDVYKNLYSDYSRLKSQK